MRASFLGTLIIAGLCLSGCGDPEPDKTAFGPLGVVEREEGDAPESAIEGRLRIADGCVDLVNGAQEVGLLFFSTLEPVWDADEQSVALVNADGDPVTFRDGDRVSFGGGGSSSEEGSPSDSYYGTDTGWLAQPSDECQREVRFEVASVTSN